MGESAPRKSPADTRQRLLLTALSLYAENGIHAVSLRSIATESGSRNSAAMHYHFGNREGVFRALLEMITAELNTYARELKGDKIRSLRQGVERSVAPIFMLAQRREWGRDAIRFMSQLLMESDPTISTLSQPYFQVYNENADAGLASVLPHLDDATRRLRMKFMAVNIFHGIAEVNLLANTPLGDQSGIAPEDFQRQLVDYLLGGLTAECFQEDVKK